MRTKNIYNLFLVTGLLFLSGCGAHTRYEWSDYDTKLYQYYQNPAEREEFVQNLKEILDDSESEGRVPPGIYAEYGYVMYEQGNSLEAVTYYQKEADKWPESKVFMNKMIDIAKKNNKKQDVKTSTVTPAFTPAADTSAVPAVEKGLVENSEVTK